MKKKVCIVIIPLVLVMVVVSIIIVKSSSTQKMLSIPKEEITKILVTDGNNGNVTELTKEQTDKLYNKLTNTKIKKKVSEDASGWLYNIDIFRKNSSISIIVFPMKNVVYRIRNILLKKIKVKKLLIWSKSLLINN